MSKESKRGVGLWTQLDYTNLKACILDEQGRMIVVPYVEFAAYYHPDNTDERLRRLALYLQNKKDEYESI